MLSHALSSLVLLSSLSLCCAIGASAALSSSSCSSAIAVGEIAVTNSDLNVLLQSGGASGSVTVLNNGTAAHVGYGSRVYLAKGCPVRYQPQVMSAARLSLLGKSFGFTVRRGCVVGGGVMRRVRERGDKGWRGEGRDEREF
jgi:hypothetical protein